MFKSFEPVVLHLQKEGGEIPGKSYSVRRLIQIVWVLLLCMGFAFNARAAFNCTPQTPCLDMFFGTFGSFFAFPEEVATLFVGARMGGLRELNLRYRCTGMSAPEKFGTGSWRDNQNWQANNWLVLKRNQDCSIPWFEYNSSHTNMNPGTSNR